jgi:hypothetical protein
MSLYFILILFSQELDLIYFQALHEQWVGTESLALVKILQPNYGIFHKK